MKIKIVGNMLLVLVNDEIIFGTSPASSFFLLFLFLGGRGIFLSTIIHNNKKNYILSRKKTSLFKKLNQTHSILLQFTQDLHLLTAYHQTKTLISRFFLLMPPLLRNGSFLFVLQSQPFYQAQLVPVTTIPHEKLPSSSWLKSQPFY